jgi:hypothetical protein
MEVFEVFTNMRAVDFLQDENALTLKQEEIQRSMSKFKKHFATNLDSLNLKEVTKSVGPKFSVCFIDLAAHLNISMSNLNTVRAATPKTSNRNLERHSNHVIKEENDDDEDESWVE